MALELFTVALGAAAVVVVPAPGELILVLAVPVFFC